MTTTTLNEYDFDSVTDYIGELVGHIAEESDAELGLISIVVESDTKKIGIFSNLNDKKLFKYLILSAFKIAPKSDLENIKSDVKEQAIKDVLDSLMRG